MSRRAIFNFVIFGLTPVVLIAGPTLISLWLSTVLGILLAVIAVRIAAHDLLSEELASGAIDDVFEIEERLNKFKTAYDPMPYVKRAPPGHVFIGLREGKGGRATVPAYVPIEVLRKSHAQLLGMSGTGKSSLAGLILGQCWALGDAIVVVDPKDDRRLPGALARFASGRRRMHILNLNPGQPAQINPLAGAAPHEVEELLCASLGLDPSGDAAVDFHRGEDRAAARMAAEIGADTIPEMFAAAAQIKAIAGKANFIRELEELASLPCFSTKTGLDLAAAIAAGDLIYIIGSANNLRVIVAQKLLLQRILQILNSRTVEEADQRPVGLMLDELKYILSNSALRAAGLIRDRNCHLIVCHQSLQDLNDCPGLPPEAVHGAIHGNTPLKFVHLLKDRKTAEDFSKIAGSRRTWAGTVNKKSELGGEDGSWREAEKSHIPVELLTHLPTPSGEEAATCVVFGLGVAFLLASRWVPGVPPPKVVPAEPLSVDSTELI